MKKIKCIFFISVIALILPLCSTVSFAAGPMMHVALGQYWLDTIEPGYDESRRKLFLLGTVFPDIRYLGVIKRHQTHYQNVSLSDIKNEKSAFMQGMLFHSFVDEYRKNWIQQHRSYQRIQEIPSRYRDTFLKLVEDQILDEHYNWNEFKQALLSIPQEEKNFKISDAALTQWHTGLTLYFATSPSTILYQISMFEQAILMLDAPTVKLWSQWVPKYAENTELRNYVVDLMKSFQGVIGGN